jgi:hypothetical protein
MAVGAPPGNTGQVARSWEKAATLENASATRQIAASRMASLQTFNRMRNVMIGWAFRNFFHDPSKRQSFNPVFIGP